MDVASLSTWIGKPPRTSKNREITASPEEAQRDSSPDSEQPAPEVIELPDSGSSDGDVVDAGVEHIDELVSAADAVPYGGSPPRANRAFIIDVPEIPNKDEYEHLPGHFTARRVLAEYPGDKYLVKLGSGEVELVSVAILIRDYLPFIFPYLAYFAFTSLGVFD